MPSEREISADFPYESHYVDVHGSQIHYIDEGEGDPILFLHGQPTSCYLWRNVIPHITSQGRGIAMDLIGFGKSGKPDIEYRFFDHVKYVEGFIEKMGLKNITLVIHDWGSALGFHYAMRHEDNVRGIAFLEAALGPPPGWDEVPEEWKQFFQMVQGPNSRELLVDQNMFVEQVLPNSVVRPLTEEEMDHYREPFLDPGTREPVWRWPQEVPIGGEPADVYEALASYGQKLPQSELPKLLLYATPGFLINEQMVEWSKQNLKNLSTAYVGEGQHYLQEDHPHEIGEALASWYQAL